MKKSLVFHLGLPKTGTTTIQSELRESDGVLEGLGLLYPGNSIDLRLGKLGYHSHFCNAIVNLHLMAVKESVSDCRRMFEEALDYFENHQNLNVMVVSHEILGLNVARLDYEYLKSVTEQFSVKFLIYFRQFGDWLESFYAHQIWYGFREPSVPRDLAPIASLQFRRLNQFLPSLCFRLLSEGYPSAEIEFKSFEMCRRQGNLLRDFANAVWPTSDVAVADVITAGRSRLQGAPLALTSFLHLVQRGNLDRVTLAELVTVLDKRRLRTELPVGLAGRTGNFLTPNQRAFADELYRRDSAKFPSLAVAESASNPDGRSAELEIDEAREIFDWLCPHLSSQANLAIDEAINTAFANPSCPAPESMLVKGGEFSDAALALEDKLGLTNDRGTFDHDNDEELVMADDTTTLEPGLAPFIAMKLADKSIEDWRAMSAGEKAPLLKKATGLLFAERRFLAKRAEETRAGSPE